MCEAALATVGGGRAEPSGGGGGHSSAVPAQPPASHAQIGLPGSTRLLRPDCVAAPKERLAGVAWELPGANPQLVRLHLSCAHSLCKREQRKAAPDGAPWTRHAFSLAALRGIGLISSVHHMAAQLHNETSSLQSMYTKATAPLPPTQPAAPP